MPNYDLVEKANRHFWKEFCKAVADLSSESPEISDSELDRLALERADRAREKFIEEAQSFTHA